MHDDDPAVPGNPPHEAEIVRRYWRSNWALLHGEEVPRPVLWTYPADGAAMHQGEAASIESWISIVFARALSASRLGAGQFHVVDSAGGEVPTQIQLFYGDGSHVVHLEPMVNLAAGEVYEVTVDPGVATIHGESLAGWSFRFSTGDVAPDPINDDGFWDEPDPYEDPPAGDTGESSGGSVDDTGAGETTTAGDGSTTTGEGSGSTTGAPAAAEGSEAGGCGCRQDDRDGEPAWAWLVLGAVCVRRRASAWVSPATRG